MDLSLDVVSRADQPLADLARVHGQFSHILSAGSRFRIQACVKMVLIRPSGSVRSSTARCYGDGILLKTAALKWHLTV